MVGSGTDTYDPTCDLPKYHSDSHRSFNAKDQYRLPETCYMCREFRGLRLIWSHNVWVAACWRHEWLFDADDLLQDIEEARQEIIKFSERGKSRKGIIKAISRYRSLIETLYEREIQNN